MVKNEVHSQQKISRRCWSGGVASPSPQQALGAVLLHQSPSQVTPFQKAWRGPPFFGHWNEILLVGSQPSSLASAADRRTLDSRCTSLPRYAPPQRQSCRAPSAAPGQGSPGKPYPPTHAAVESAAAGRSQGRRRGSATPRFTHGYMDAKWPSGKPSNFGTAALFQSRD